MALLEVRDLKVVFDTDQGVVTAVDGVNLSVEKGETVGVVGESGCGKTVTALSIMRLLRNNARIVSGEILFDGEDLVQKTQMDMCNIRGKRISMVFQEPMTSLNPVYTCGDQVVEAILAHRQVSREEAWRETVRLFASVGIPNPESRANAYPHQLSGGLRQRVMIAMALACDPEMLIADEPTTALDVTVQAQLLRLIKDIQHQKHMSLMLITHDLGVVAEVADRIYVMYAGQVMEYGGVFSIFEKPLHPYTYALLQSRPYFASDELKPKRLKAIRGTVPSLLKVIPGCRFHPRCDEASSACCSTSPPLVEVEDGHWVRCNKFARVAL